MDTEIATPETSPSVWDYVVFSAGLGATFAVIGIFTFQFQHLEAVVFAKPIAQIWSVDGMIPPQLVALLRTIPPELSLGPLFFVNAIFEFMKNDTWVWEGTNGLVFGSLIGFLIGMLQRFTERDASKIGAVGAAILFSMMSRVVGAALWGLGGELGGIIIGSIVGILIGNFESIVNGQGFVFTLIGAVLRRLTGSNRTWVLGAVVGGILGTSTGVVYWPYSAVVGGMVLGALSIPKSLKSHADVLYLVIIGVIISFAGALGNIWAGVAVGAIIGLLLTLLASEKESLIGKLIDGIPFTLLLMIAGAGFGVLFASANLLHGIVGGLIILLGSSCLVGFEKITDFVLGQMNVMIGKLLKA